MVKRKIHVLLLSCVLALSSTATVFAVDTPPPTSPSAPSPQVSAKSKPVKHLLTQAQKEAIADARLAFAKAKANAQDGFDRAVADAQAIRDQAIVAAGTDKNALSAARKDYRNSYLTILNAFKISLKNARAIFQSELASAKVLSRSH